MFELNESQIKFFKELNTANKIQDYLDSLPFNYEKEGETCYSPIQVLENKKCHCIEGAFLAGCAFLVNNKPSQIISLKIKP